MIIGPNNFGSQKFASNKMMVQKNFEPQKIGVSLVEIGSDIADMDKCHRNKCCMEKCHPDICFYIVYSPMIFVL